MSFILSLPTLVTVTLGLQAAGSSVTLSVILHLMLVSSTLAFAVFLASTSISNLLTFFLISITNTSFTTAGFPALSLEEDHRWPDLDRELANLDRRELLQLRRRRGKMNKRRSLLQPRSSPAATSSASLLQVFVSKGPIATFSLSLDPLSTVSGLKTAISEHLSLTVHAIPNLLLVAQGRLILDDSTRVSSLGTRFVEMRIGAPGGAPVGGSSSGVKRKASDVHETSSSHVRPNPSIVSASRVPGLAGTIDDSLDEPLASLASTSSTALRPPRCTLPSPTRSSTSQPLLREDIKGKGRASAFSHPPPLPPPAAVSEDSSSAEEDDEVAHLITTLTAEYEADDDEYNPALEKDASRRMRADRAQVLKEGRPTAAQAVTSDSARAGFVEFSARPYESTFPSFIDLRLKEIAESGKFWAKRGWITTGVRQLLLDPQSLVLLRNTLLPCFPIESQRLLMSQYRKEGKAPVDFGMKPISRDDEDYFDPGGYQIHARAGNGRGPQRVRDIAKLSVNPPPDWNGESGIGRGDFAIKSRVRGVYGGIGDGVLGVGLRIECYGRAGDLKHPKLVHSFVHGESPSPPPDNEPPPYSSVRNSDAVTALRRTNPGQLQPSSDNAPLSATPDWDFFRLFSTQHGQLSKEQMMVLEQIITGDYCRDRAWALFEASKGRCSTRPLETPEYPLNRIQPILAAWLVVKGVDVVARRDRHAASACWSADLRTRFPQRDVDAVTSRNSLHSKLFGDLLDQRVRSHAPNAVNALQPSRMSRLEEYASKDIFFAASAHADEAFKTSFSAGLAVLGPAQAFEIQHLSQEQYSWLYLAFSSPLVEVQIEDSTAKDLAARRAAWYNDYSWVPDEVKNSEEVKKVLTQPYFQVHSTALKAMLRALVNEKFGTDHTSDRRHWKYFNDDGLRFGLKPNAPPALVTGWPLALLAMGSWENAHMATVDVEILRWARLVLQLGWLLVSRVHASTKRAQVTSGGRQGGRGQRKREK